MTETDKDVANNAFTAPRRADDGKKTMAEYEAAALVARAKTERLKALRLARDAELAKTEPKPAKRKSPGRAAKRSAASLSDFLDAQERGGRRA